MTTNTNNILCRGILTAFALGFALLAAGCLTSFHALQNAPGISIRTEDSPKVSITKAWLERHDNKPLVIAGNVVRVGAGDTSSSRISVKVLDAHQNELFAAETFFTPRDLPTVRRPAQSSGSFRRELGKLPPSAVEIHVRAID